MDFHSLMGQASTMMLSKRNDDSTSDRLNYRFTVGILVVFAIINMNRLYTDQIKCWVRLYEFKILFLTEFFFFLLLQTGTSILYTKL